MSTVSEKDIARYRRNLHGEVDSAALYRALGDVEGSPELAEVYHRLAAVEDRHAELGGRASRQQASPQPTSRRALERAC